MYHRAKITIIKALQTGKEIHIKRHAQANRLCAEAAFTGSATRVDPKMEMTSELVSRHAHCVSDGALAELRRGRLLARAIQCYEPSTQNRDRQERSWTKSG
jgi:hypothetical protein